MIGLYIGLGIAAVVIAFLAVIIVRTLRFVPKEAEREEPSPVTFDGDKAVSDLCEMIRCKTVSHTDPALDDESEFQKFKALLPRLFPLVYQRCELENVNNRAMLFRWRGESCENPTVLMAHFDVVSVVDELWDKPAFDGIVEEGVIWGRGVIDTKGSLNAILQAAEKLIAEQNAPSGSLRIAHSRSAPRPMRFWLIPP